MEISATDSDPSIIPKSAPVLEVTFQCCRHEKPAGTLHLYPDSKTDGLVLGIQTFVCAQLSAVSSAMMATFRDLFDRRDAEGLYRIDIEFAPFYCPCCREVYCGDCWDRFDVFADDHPCWFEETRGICPNGHERLLVD